MRGKAETYEGDDYAGRITPAYAGKRYVEIPPILTEEDHPRLCGEKTCILQKLQRKIGSPPPMRGKVISHRSDLEIIKDHPRLCGEKLRRMQKNLAVTGSPPPMRGKVRATNRDDCVKRITPAYAGKSSTDFMLEHNI